jgi:type III pantothenate kinase
MLATLDVDNTQVTVGVFEGPDLRTSFALATDLRRTEDEYAYALRGLLTERGISCEQIEGTAIASVVPPLTEPFERVTRRLFGQAPLVVGAGTRTGVRIATQNPREVGANRIVNAAGAFHLHGGPAIVVDFGTATSFDVVGGDGAYLGSVIAPGMALAAEALVQQASRLYRVDLITPQRVVGRDTTGALQSGIVLGHAAMVEGMLQRIQAEIEQRCVVVVTGQLASVVLTELSGIDFVEPALSLLGLRLLYELNQRGSER